MTCGCLSNMGSAFSFIAEVIPQRLYFGVVHPDKCPNNTRRKDFLYFKFNVRKIGLYFGPPHIGLVYKYIKELNQALRKNPKKTIIHVAFTTEKKMTTNSAMLVGAFAILQLRMHPDSVINMFANSSNIFLSYPDTTGLLNQARISLEAFFYGLKKAAIDNDFFNIRNFNIAEYDKILFGMDVSWVIPDKFIAFSTIDVRDQDFFLRVTKLVNYFRRNNVQTIVRLTKPLYDSRIFQDSGFQFYDLFFPDCTAPPFEIVERFLEIVESTDGGIAVHCFAGMGRTGTLIACYMIKHLDFSASEATAWCRLCRYGSIIGVQYKFLERHESVLKLMGLQYKKMNNFRSHCQFDRPICGTRHRHGTKSIASTTTDSITRSKVMNDLHLTPAANHQSRAETASHARTKVTNNSRTRV